MRTATISDCARIRIEALLSVVGQLKTGRAVAITLHTARRVHATLFTLAIFGGTFINIDARNLIVGQAIAIRTATPIAALSVVTEMRTIAGIPVTFVNILARHRIICQFHTCRTQTLECSDDIFTRMRTGGRRIAITLVNVHTDAIRATLMPVGAFAMKRSYCVHTIAGNGATSFQRTLIDVVAIEMVARQLESDRTLAFVCSRHIYAFMRTIIDLKGTFVNVATRVPVIGQFVASFARTQIRSGRIYTNIRAISIIINAFVHIYTRSVIGAQLKAHITFAHMTSGQIFALMCASTVLLRTLVHIFANLFGGVVETIATRTRAIHDAIFEIATVRTAAVVDFAFILIVTRVIIYEKLTLRTGTLVAAERIDACVRAISVVCLTFVHIETAMLIATIVVSASTLTHIRSNRVPTLVIAISIVRLALVDIFALAATFVDGTETSETGTLESTVQIAAILCAATVAAFAFIDIGTRSSIVCSLVAGEALASICFGVADLRTAAVVRVANVHCNTRPTICRQSRAFCTIANHLILHRIANSGAASIVDLAKIDILDVQLDACLQIAGQFQPVGAFAMIAIDFVDTLVRAFRLGFIAQMLAQVSFACALIGLQMEICWAFANE